MYVYAVEIGVFAKCYKQRKNCNIKLVYKMFWHIAC